MDHKTAAQQSVYFTTLVAGTPDDLTQIERMKAEGFVQPTPQEVTASPIVLGGLIEALSIHHPMAMEDRKARVSRLVQAGFDINAKHHNLYGETLASVVQDADTAPGGSLAELYQHLLTEHASYVAQHPASAAIATPAQRDGTIMPLPEKEIGG